MHMSAGLVVAAVLAFIAFLIWNRTRTTLERQRLQLDAQTRMLDRVGSGPALAEFLKTDEGQRFLKQIAPARAARERRPRPDFHADDTGARCALRGLHRGQRSLAPDAARRGTGATARARGHGRPPGVLADGSRCRCAGRRVDHAPVVEEMGHAGRPRASSNDRRYASDGTTTRRTVAWIKRHSMPSSKTRRPR